MMRVDLRDQLAGLNDNIGAPPPNRGAAFFLAAIAAPVLGEAQPSLSITRVGRFGEAYRHGARGKALLGFLYFSTISLSPSG